MQDIYLKSKTGFKWAVFSKGIVGGIGFSMLLFFTYYLGQEKLGIISILMVIYSLSEVLVEFGISQSIIARDKNSDKELSSIFWTNLAIGFFVFIGVNLIAKLISSFYGRPELELFIRVLSIIFIIEPLDLVFRAILEKELRFPILEKINILRYLVLGIGTVVLILLGFNIFGYIIGMIASIVVSTMAFAYIFIKERIWFPQFHFKFEDIKEHYKFGFYVTAKSFLNYIGRNFDELIIGKILGMEILGIYYFAKKIIEQPTRLFSASFAKISFPMFSKLKNSVFVLKKTFTNLLSVVSLFGFFFFGLIFLISPEIMSLFFGDNLTGVHLVKIFSIMALMEIISAGFSSSILYIYNKAKYLFFVDLLLTPLRIIIISLMTFVSIEFVATGYLLSMFFKVVILQSKINKIINIKFKEIFGLLSVKLFGILIAVIMATILGYFFKEIMLLIIIKILIYSIIYVLINLIFDKDIKILYKLILWQKG